MKLKDNNGNFLCRVCGQDEFGIWGKRDDLIFYKCAECGLVFYYPYPTQEDLNIFYNETYHKVRGYDGVSTEEGAKRRQMYELDITDLKNNLPMNKGRFLDIGCAEGVFLSLLDNSWEKYGIDVSAPAIESAKKYGVNVSTKNIDEFEDNFFDVIHMRGVFEHILYPLELLNTVAKKIRSGGYLVISTTPNMAGFVPRFYRGKFRLAEFDHVNYYCSKTMKLLMNKINFMITNITYPYFGTPYCNFFKDLWSIAVNKFKDKESPPFYGNIFSIYAKKIG